MFNFNSGWEEKGKLILYSKETSLHNIIPGEIQSADAIKYEVLFDEPFIGGLSYGECNSHLYTMLPFTLMNFSYGMRLTQVFSVSISVSLAISVFCLNFWFQFLFLFEFLVPLLSAFVSFSFTVLLLLTLSDY